MDDVEFGLRTTLLGMGIVFGMLVLLWGLLAVALRFEQHATSSAPPAAPAASDARGVQIVDAGSLDPALVAAITVAIVRHAEARRLQAAPAMRSNWPGSLLFASRWVAAGRTRQGQHWPRRR